MRLAQRLKMLEKTMGSLKQTPSEAPEIELTDEERADKVGEFLWLQKAISKEYPPRYPSSVPPAPPGDPMHAWNEAAELAWQQGHRDYHSGLRSYAMPIWLKWKPDILKAERAHRDWVRVHGEWVWDVAPRLQGITKEEFRQLPLGEQIAALRDQGSGHWAKDVRRRSAT